MMDQMTPRELIGELIQPPINWPQFQTIAPIVDLVLGGANDIPVLDSLDEQLGLTIPSLRAHCRSVIASNNPEKFNGQTDRIKITQYPVYSMLSEIAHCGDHRSMERVNLATLCILAIYRGIRPVGMHTSRKIPSTNVDSACRAVRLLPERVIQLAGKNLTDLPSGYRHLVRVHDNVENHLSGNEGAYLSSIRRVIGLSLGEEAVLYKGARSTREDQSPVNPAAALLNTIITDDPHGDGQEHEAMTVRLIPDMDQATFSIVDEARIQGASQDDVAKTQTLVKAVGRQSSTKGETLARSVQNQRHVANQIRRSAQHLSMQWNRLSEYDVWVLVSHISELSGDIAERAGCVLLALSLITGRQPSSLRSTRLYNQLADIPASISEHTIGICRETHEWIGMSPAPENIRPISIEWQRNLIQTSQRIRMPIPSHIWTILNQFFSSITEWKGRALGRIVDEDNVEKLISKILGELRKSSNVRLTPVRICRHIFNTIADRGGDVVEATMITRVQPPDTQLTGLNYYCVAESSLQRTYLNAIQTLPIAAGSNSAPTPMCLDLNTPHFIGSRFCPKRSRLPLLVDDLNSLVTSCRQTRMIDRGVADFHNAYAARTIFLVLFATGYRSVHGLFSRESDLDTESEFLVIADKVGDDMNHSRIVPTPTVLREQLTMYTRHRRAVSDQLYLLSRQSEPNHQFFWIHAKTLKAITVTPSNLSERFNEFFNLPLNANRHYLRSELRDRGVSPLLVDAFMGHWTDGCEPFGRYSTLSPVDYRKKLLPALTSILDDMGWRAMEGLA